MILILILRGMRYLYITGIRNYSYIISPSCFPVAEFNIPLKNLAGNHLDMKFNESFHFHYLILVVIMHLRYAYIQRV